MNSDVAICKTNAGGRNSTSLDNTFQIATRQYTRLRKNHHLSDLIVFGAGLSKSYGFPLSGELLGTSLEFHENRYGSAKLRLLNEFLEYFYPIRGGIRANALDFEDVLGMIDAVSDYSNVRNNRFPGFKWRSGEIESIRHRLIRCVTEYLWARQEDALLTGMAKLRDLVQSIGPNAVYVTFNYDLLLEAALSMERIPYTYTLSRSPDIVSVLKPHGSINWYENKIAAKSPKSLIWHNIGDNVAVCTNLVSTKWCARHPAIIIPPTPNKKYEIHEIKKTWTSFSSAVTNCPRLTVIGYSMPGIDRFARFVLRKAGPGHNCRKIKVVVPDSIEPTYERYVSPEVEHARTKFEHCDISRLFEKI